MGMDMRKVVHFIKRILVLRTGYLLQARCIRGITEHHSLIEDSPALEIALISEGTSRLHQHHIAYHQVLYRRTYSWVDT